MEAHLQNTMKQSSKQLLILFHHLHMKHTSPLPHTLTQSHRHHIYLHYTYYNTLPTKTTQHLLCHPLHLTPSNTHSLTWHASHGLCRACFFRGFFSSQSSYLLYQFNEILNNPVNQYSLTLQPIRLLAPLLFRLPLPALHPLHPIVRLPPRINLHNPTEACTSS